MGIAVVDREVGYAESWQEEGKGLDVGRGGKGGKLGGGRRLEERERCERGGRWEGDSVGES